MKATILVAVFALVISFSLAAHKFTLLLDNGVALDDARSEMERQRDRSNHALMIIKAEWIGRSFVDVIELSDKFKRKGSIIKINEDNIEIEDMIFNIKDGVVIDVKYFD